jgi:hypothetical protein
MPQTNEMMEKFCQIFHPGVEPSARVATAIVACASFLAACGASGGDDAPPIERPEGRYALTNHVNWSATDSDNDPFLDRPAQVDCPANSFGPEELNGESTFAVDTDFCDYLTARQPTTDDVFAGDTLHYRIFHFALEPEQPGTTSQSHVALRIGDQVLADETIEIPSTSALLAGSFPAERDMPAGTLVYFHVHNHGANEYSLVELSAEAPSP